MVETERFKAFMNRCGIVFPYSCIADENAGKIEIEFIVSGKLYRSVTPWYVN